jgi:DNA mismatch endonuclease (patch repair protein)
MSYDFSNTSPERSKIMKAIKRKDTKVELLLRKELYRRGIRYRVDYGNLPGRPDIAITSRKIAIFCDSEFWHGRNWEVKRTKIKSNREYWIPKIERNIERDQQANEALVGLGWRVFHYWEPDIKKKLASICDEIEEACHE